MNFIVRKIVLFTIYMILSFFLFLELVNILQFPENTTHNLTNIDEYTLVLENEIIKDKILNLSKQGRVEEFKEDDSFDLGKSILERYVFFKYIFKNNNHIIPLIYIMLLLIYIMQVFLFLTSKYYIELINIIPAKKLNNIFFYSSDFAINSPAILGVIGTIFSLGMMVNNISDASTLNIQFKENFANLSQTTIIGGVVYVINLFLNILINKNISLDYHK